MDTFITSRATQHEVNSLDKRLKMLLSRKRLNHNPKGIEGFSTLGTPKVDPIVGDTIPSSTDEATDYTATYEEYVKTQKEKWTKAFAFLTKANLKKPSEWHNVIKGIVYAFPISVEIIVDEFADSMPVLPEGGTVRQYYKNREDDKKFLKESVYEFGYVLVSMYISHMLYTRLYTGNKLASVSEAWNFSFIPGLKHLIDTEIFVYYLFAPYVLQKLVTGFLPNIIKFFVYSNYFSLRIFALFIVCYFLTYYFFDIIVKMFLQSIEAIFGLLSFKIKTGSTPFTYAMIMGGLFQYLFDTRNLLYVFSSTSMTFGIYLAFFFLHLITTIIFAPFCQLIFVFYVMYVMFGGPSDIGKLVLSWFVKTVNSFFKDVEVDVAQSNMSNPDEIFGGFDLLSYKYGYSYFFFFIMLLFFFFKTIQSAVDLKTTSIRTAVSTSNAYITATMLVIYLAKYFTNKPVKRQEFSIGKKPVAKEEPGVASDSEDSDSDVDSDSTMSYDEDPESRSVVENSESGSESEADSGSKFALLNNKYILSPSESTTSKSIQTKTGGNLWLPPKYSTNGNNKCWLNAPLYALLSNDKIREIIEKTKTNTTDFANKEFKQGVLISDIIDGLKMMIDPNNVWDTDNYKKFLEMTSKFGNNTITDEVVNGNAYYDAAEIMNQFEEIFNEHILANKDLRLKIAEHGELIKDSVRVPIPESDKNIISFVSSTKCTNHQQRNISHYFSFVKHDKTWYMVDALAHEKNPKTNAPFKPTLVDYNYIKKELKECNSPKIQERAMYSIRLVSVEEFNKIEKELLSQDEGKDHAISSYDTIQHNTLPDKYFVLHRGKEKKQLIAIGIKNEDDNEYLEQYTNIKKGKRGADNNFLFDDNVIYEYFDKKKTNDGSFNINENYEKFTIIEAADYKNYTVVKKAEDFEKEQKDFEEEQNKSSPSNS